MSESISSEFLIKLMAATPEQKAAIGRILDGKFEAQRPASSGPILMTTGKAAEFLGVSRATFWRMEKIGKIKKIEILPGSFRVRRSDLEKIFE